MHILVSQVHHKCFDAGSTLTAVFGILAAMSVFSYLFSTKSAGFFHALPIKREGLFITNYLSGLSFLIVPAFIVFILTAALLSLNGFLSIPVLLSWLGVVCALSLFFYSFGVFCAMFTGNLIALPIFYVILNFTAVGLEYLIKMTLSAFVFGMTYNKRLVLGFLSPYYQMNLSGTVVNDQIACWNLLLGYAAAGVVFVVFALLIYRKRRVESAGDVIAIRSVRPVFKYGAAFSLALLVSVFLNQTFGRASVKDSFWRVLVCMLSAGFVGYFISEMLMKKTLRVFRSGVRGWLLFSAVMIALLFSFKLDLYGYARRVPSADAISRAYFGDYIYFSSGSSEPSHYYGLKAEDNVKLSQIVGLHRSIVNSRAELEGFEDYAIPLSEKDKHSMVFVGIYYMMKDGSTLLRSYRLPVTEELLQNPESPAARYLAIMNDPDTILSMCFPRELTKMDFENGSIHPGDDRQLQDDADGLTIARPAQSILLNQDQSFTLYQAIVRDIKDGNIGRIYPLTNSEYKNRVYTCSILLAFSGNFPDWRGGYGSGVASFQLETTSVNTINALRNMGLLDGIQLVTLSGRYAAEEADGRFADIPDEIVAFYDTYMESFKKGTKEAVQYVYFNNDGKVAAFLNSDDRVLDYRVENIDKVNNKLYAFTVSVSTTTELYLGKDYRTIYNYVGIIEGKLRVMTNEIHIPEELRDNFDPGKYVYTDPDVLGPET